MKPNKTLKLNTKNDNILWTSDTHFGHDTPHWEHPLHKQRGFNNVIDMRETLIEDVNKSYTSFHNQKGRNVLIHLGDFEMGCSMEDTIAILNCMDVDQMFYIWGNHERRMPEIFSKEDLQSQIKFPINFLGHYRDIRVDDDMIAAMHYPIASWNKKHYGAWMLQGHCHNSYELGKPFNLDDKILDVGIESALQYTNNEKTIFTHEDVRLIMENKKYGDVDHHTHK